ncbi:MAG: bifunctional 4-hydroxy-2-oxoglutarate aldolase/2-dehydro-3-deoxy-phosphogluconate aldolase [Pseudomonadota bacterium]
MITVDEIIARAPVIPVITIEKLADALPLCQALVSGGLTVLEVTLRTPVALQAIRELSEQLPQAIVGAGTVLTEQQAMDAKAAGARFFVSPGSTPAVLSAAEKAGILLLPGAATPTEMMALAERGYTLQKFFPAEAAGGVDMLRSLAAPLAHIRFCPTGGITPDNANAYLALPNVVVVGGSWMVSKKLVDGHQWTEIERLSRLAAALSR